MLSACNTTELDSPVLHSEGVFKPGERVGKKVFTIGQTSQNKEYMQFPPQPFYGKIEEKHTAFSEWPLKKILLHFIKVTV